MQSPIDKATVIGAGAMGTFCAIVLGSRGTRVTLWARSPDRAAEIERTRENRQYLPGHRLPDSVSVTSDRASAFAGAELIVSAVPCQHMRSMWEELALAPRTRAPVVSVSKGVEVRTLKRPSQIIEAVLGDVPAAALSGPCLAPEAAAGLPTAVVTAANELEIANLIQDAFSTPTFRVYTNTDLIGIELGGAAKNVIALAAGACDGLQLGNNAKASLLTRGLVEITRLGVAMGAHADTFRGLAGIGDLIATCNSTISRNHTAGMNIGRGMPVDKVIRTAHGVVEGIETTRSILQLAEMHHVEMPITRAIHTVLFEHESPKSAIAALMTRRLKDESIV